MGKAVRAIIIENNQLLVMARNKQGEQYYTLVGGRANEGEALEQTLVREVKEETGLDVIGASLMYFEDHPEPYNQQYVFLCNIGPHQAIVLQPDSEEHVTNKLGFNTHHPLWIPIHTFGNLAFRTPLLQAAIVKALKTGFPNQPQKLS